MDLDLKKQRSLLEAKRVELEQSIAALTRSQNAILASTEVNGEPTDNAENAVDPIEMEQEQSIQANEEILYTLVVNALKRLEDGTYGLCQVCGRPIPARRLEAIPWAERDVSCEEALERQDSNREDVYGAP